MTRALAEQPAQGSNTTFVVDSLENQIPCGCNTRVVCKHDRSFLTRMKAMESKRARVLNCKAHFAPTLQEYCWVPVIQINTNASPSAFLAVCCRHMFVSSRDITKTNLTGS